MTSLNPIRTIGSQITEVIVKHQGVDLIEARKIAVDLMKRVGINNAENRFDEYPFMYSGGMRQRYRNCDCTSLPSTYLDL